jgi:hypothetical protein
MKPYKALHSYWLYQPKLRWTILNVIDYSRANFIRPPWFGLLIAGNIVTAFSAKSGKRTLNEAETSCLKSGL